MDLRDYQKSYGRALRRYKTGVVIRKRLRGLARVWGNEVSLSVRMKVAKTGRVCSCKLCGNPRRHYGERTPQERRFFAERAEDLL